VIKCFSFFLVPSYSSNTPLYPQTVVSQGTCPNSLPFQCFHFKLTLESIKELRSTSKSESESVREIIKKGGMEMETKL
jgi:hypothetical protein